MIRERHETRPTPDGRTIVVIVLALAVATGGFAAVPLAAADPPAPPASFYGELTIDGEPAPAGSEVVALIDDEVRGSLLTDEEGLYGGPAAVDEKLIVEADASESGEEITFIVNGEKAEETASWESASDQRLDLSVDGPADPPDDGDDEDGDDEDGDDGDDDDADDGDDEDGDDGDDDDADDGDDDDGDDGDDDDATVPPPSGDDDDPSADEDDDAKDDATDDQDDATDDEDGDDDADDGKTDASDDDSDAGDDTASAGPADDDVASDDDEDEPTPGLGPVIAVLALLASAAALARWRARP